MSAALDAASWVLLVAGGLFCIVGAAGLLRMPDFYTRMHAASVTDTLGAGCILLGLMLQAGGTLVALKLAVIGLLIFFTSPAATHALARAALSRGVEPLLDREEGAIETLIINVLLTVMAVTVVAMASQRNLFAVVVLFGIYSFLMATVLAALDAADVAMTEAAVGAGVSTVLMLSALYLTGGTEAKPLDRPLLPLALSVAAGAVLVYGMQGLPAFSDPQAPIHTHVAPRYLEGSLRETGVPNVVTAVLASYRGYDTLGETAVVFTAGIGVIVLLRRRARKGK